MAVGIQSGTKVGWAGMQDSAAPYGHALSITVGSGADRILLCGAQAVTGYNANRLTATFNGAVMTKLDGGGAYGYAVLFYLLNPPTGTHDLVVGYPGWEANALGMQAAVFEGVNQTTPLGTNTKVEGTSVTTPLDSPLTATANEATFATFAMYNGGTVTPAAGQVQVVAQGAVDGVIAYSSYKIGASSSVGCSWTGGPNQGAQLAVVLKAAAGGGTDATATGATLTGTSSISAGSATGGSGSTGSFTSDAMENNTGAGLLANTSVTWTWWQGAIGATPTSLTHGTGTTSAGGILSLTGLPTGAGFLLVRTADSAGVYYQPGTVT